MKIEITGNPGTGNSFTEVHINNVENYNPNATTVNNYNYGSPESKTKEKSKLETVIDHSAIRQEILDYVRKTSVFLYDDYKASFIKMWGEILDKPLVAAKIYDKGKQKGTNFNRNLVANILHYLNGRKFFKEYAVSTIAKVLEGDEDSSVRAALARDPQPEIVSTLNRYFD